MFGGFKASLNFFGKKNKKDLHSELTPDMCVSGAYRTSRDDSFGYRNSSENSKKPSASEQVIQPIRPTKSASDLTKSKNLNPNLSYSTADVSRDPRGAEQVDIRNGEQTRKEVRNQEREQQKIEKQRLAEQRAREKQAAQERTKQEKLRKEKEKKEGQKSKGKKSAKKNLAPQPQLANSAQTSAQYPTNTLESSISRSSGPPPYSDVPLTIATQNVPSQNDSSGNVAFSKPLDTGSWDMISQHRQQVIRPTNTIGNGGKQNKQTVMDLNYNFGAASQSRDISDA